MKFHLGSFGLFKEFINKLYAFYSKLQKFKKPKACICATVLLLLFLPSVEAQHYG